MSRLFLIVLLVMGSGPAYAEWMWIDKGKPGMTIYINPDTIRHKGNLVTMWELFDFETAEKMASDPHLSFKRQSEYDCKEGRKRRLAAKFSSSNMGRGKMVYSNSAKDQWELVPPGSVNGDLWKFACGKRRLQSQILV